MGRTEVNNGRTLCLLKVGTVEKSLSLRDMVVPKTLANFLKRIGADLDALGNTSGTVGDR